MMSDLREGRMTVSCSACLAATCPATSSKVHWAASSIISLITI